MPVAALNAQSLRGDFAEAKVPVLFIWAVKDRVVDHSVTDRIAGNWGGEVQKLILEPGPSDDPDDCDIDAGHVRLDRQDAWSERQREMIAHVGL